MSKNYLDADGLDHYHKGISDILDKNLNGDFVENNEFTFRATDGITSIKTGTAYLERIKGNTVKWNQLLRANKLVDMGLPSGTLWATCDIDVTKADKFCETPFTYEKYLFSWGNVDGYSSIGSYGSYNWGGVNGQAPWYEGQPYGETQGNALTSNIPQNADYDAARHHLGASWRMPTRSEFLELFANTRYINADGTEIDSSVTDKRVTVNGVFGIYLESTINGARLFFSCSGLGRATSVDFRERRGYYWSSTWNSDRYALYMFFSAAEVRPYTIDNRHFGCAIRPVTNSAIVTDEDGHKYAVSGKYIIDLTLMYGEGNEPSTIAQFEADYYKWFGKPITSEGYTEGELRDVKMSAIKTIGFNAFDGQITKNAYYSSNSPTPTPTSNYDCTTNLIKVIGGASYYVSFTAYGYGYVHIRYYDSAGNVLNPSSVGTTVLNNHRINVPDNATHIAFNSYFQQHFPDNFLLCVHLVHSGKRNGEYEPHWEETKNVPITTLTGKLNGEGESVIVFPDGMKSIGEVQDEILIENGKTYAIQRVARANMGGLKWILNTNYAEPIFTVQISTMKIDSGLLSSKYECISAKNIHTFGNSPATNKRVTNRSGYNVILAKDLDYATAADFKAAMAGVMLYYELATPLIYELDNFQLPLPYRVDDYGTEEIKGAEKSVAPILDIRYGINIIDTIRNLPKTINSIETEISDANDRIDDAFDAIDAKEDKLAFSHSTSEVPPSTALTFTPNVNTIYYQHESTPLIGNINMVLPVPTTERATIKVIYRNSTADAPTITSAEGVNVIIESNIGGPYRLTTINCEWYHDCWVVDIQTHGT